MTRLWIVVGKRKKSTELKRPIQHLIPVECKETGKSDVMDCAVTTSLPTAEPLEKDRQSTRNARGRTRRQAADHE